MSRRCWGRMRSGAGGCRACCVVREDVMQEFTARFLRCEFVLLVLAWLGVRPDGRDTDACRHICRICRRFTVSFLLMGHELEQIGIPLAPTCPQHLNRSQARLLDHAPFADPYGNLHGADFCFGYGADSYSFHSLNCKPLSLHWATSSFSS